MNWWHVVLVLALWGGLCGFAGVVTGTGERNRLRDMLEAAEYTAAAAYDRGWDDRGLTVGRAADHLTAVLSTGRGAAGSDGPAPLPAPPMMCPGGRRCIRGPEPHQWSADCEEDEGWADLPGRDITVADNWTVPAGGLTDDERADDQWADTLSTMRRELAAEEDERPATRTDQFRAVFSRADGLERECLLTWNDARRFERSRPAHLREMGISEKRIRELLGAE